MKPMKQNLNFQVSQIYEKGSDTASHQGRKPKKLLFTAHVSTQSYREWHGMATA